MRKLIELFPQTYTRQMQELDYQHIEEIRLNVGQPVTICTANSEKQIWPAVTQSDVERVLINACRQSVYAYNETLRQGYITLEGGHRIGVCGFGVVRNAELHTIQSPSSLNIRIAKQILGCASKLLPQITSSTLLMGPPGSGKTTLLRDLVRQISDVRCQRVSLVDERSEISAGVFGLPQLEIGRRTDVLINVPKAVASLMMLKTMNPQWIAMDEITSSEDIAAMEQIAYCGVSVLATAHGAGEEDLEGRPLYRAMMQRGIFKKVIFLFSDKSFEIKEY